MNLLQRLFGKKKVEKSTKKEVITPKEQTFRHIPKYQSDTKWYEEKKRKEEDERTNSYDSIDSAVMFSALLFDSNSESSNSSNNSFDGGFGGGDFSGGGASGDW